ncbi:unnamed protein product, partial [Mesorhabditis spiculigera]
MRRIFYAVPLFAIDVFAGNCTDDPVCPTLMLGPVAKSSVKAKCSCIVAIFLPSYAKGNFLLTIGDVCPVMCGTCAPPTTATSTTKKPTTTTLPDSERYQQILEADEKFNELTNQLMDLGIQLNATDGLDRYAKYEQQKVQVDAHNEKYEAGETLYQEVLNKFSVMKSTERAPLSLIVQPFDTVPTTEAAAPVARKKRDAENATVDWRPYFGDIMDQGSCGGCWGFAMNGLLEGWLSIKGVPTPQLSVQQILDCDRQVDPTYGLANKGCDGGYFQVATNYLSTKSLTTSATYPFRGSSNATCLLSGFGSSLRVSSFDTGFITTTNKTTTSKFISLSQDMEDRVRKGPVAVGMAVADELYAYGGGIYDGPCASTINHAVVIVGFTEQYWIIRNSWGPTWGESGYVRVLRRNGTDPCSLTSYWATILQFGTTEDKPNQWINIPSGQNVTASTEEPEATTTTVATNSTGTCDACSVCSVCGEDDDDDDDDDGSFLKSS